MRAHPVRDGFLAFHADYRIAAHQINSCDNAFTLLLDLS
jgi:hypothetical protein